VSADHFDWVGELAEASGAAAAQVATGGGTSAEGGES
jgi:hypothetical protein